MIIIEEAKQLLCNGCGSKLGVIASDIQEGKTSSSGKTDEQKKTNKYWICPLCHHDNYLKEEDVPKRNSSFITDIEASYAGTCCGD